MSAHVGNGSLRKGDDLQIFYFNTVRTINLCVSTLFQSVQQKEDSEKNIIQFHSYYKRVMVVASYNFPKAIPMND